MHVTLPQSPEAPKLSGFIDADIFNLRDKGAINALLAHCYMSSLSARRRLRSLLVMLCEDEERGRRSLPKELSSFFRRN